MATAPSESSQSAADLVAHCLAQWDTGGRERLHAALIASTEAQAHSALPHTFVHLWKALLFLHATAPSLNTSAFISLIEALPPTRAAVETLEQESEHAGNVSTDGAGPSRLSTPAVQTGTPPAVDSESPFAHIILDVIWAVDVEIELRREVAEAGGLASLLMTDEEQSEANKGKGKKRNSASDEAKAAKENLADLVRNLMTSSCLSRASVAERLEIPMLTAIGLLSDDATFNKKGVRINTSNLYKQQKFNLLREENEGYSGLINELLGGMGPELIALYDVPFDKPHDWYSAAARVVEQEKPEQRNRRARGVMRNISALIGYFDLDPSRVLDMILDVFASNVTLHWPFFLSLVAASPWTRDRRRSHMKYDQEAGSRDDVMDLDGPESSIADTIVDPSTNSNSTCAQLLGFKFDYYRLPETREEVPAELYLMSALLIKEGVISFSDLWNHLSPSEEGMKALQSEYNAALKSKATSARSNALTMAAPLADDDNAEAAGGNADKDKEAELVTKNPPNQILGLLKALLSLGELKHAQFILGLYPWLVGCFPEVAELFARLLKVVVEPLYRTATSPAVPGVFSEEFLNGTRMRFNVQRQALFPSPPPRLVPTALAIEPISTAHSRYVFAFGDSWMRSLPQCRSQEDIGSILLPLLRLLGVHLHINVSLFQHVCRLGRAHLKNMMCEVAPDGSVPRLRGDWLEIIRFHLLPALSLTNGNAGLLNELWSLLQVLPYEERFTLYGEWKNELYRRPEVRYRQMETEKEAKGILKRISKDNLKISGRALAKASHANPLIFFTVALNQVQVYDNMIPHIVECAKYLTPLEYDVFSFNLIDALSNPEKERTKQDGTNISLWLKSLASFAGTLYRRYASMDPLPVLQYIANQLKANNSKDLVIVCELVLKMSGIEPLANLADKQIAALSGGRSLRMEAMMAANAGPGTPARQQIRRTGARLMASLRHSRLDVALLLLIAQQRQVCVHLVPEQEAHLRYLGNLADSCQEVLFQYVEFLHSQVEPAAYAELVPNLRALCVRFDIEPAIAFHLARPRLLYAMKQADDAEAEQKLRAELLASKARTASPVVNKEEETNDQSIEGAVSSNAVTVSASPTTGTTDDKDKALNIWRAGLQEAIDVASDLLSEGVKRVLTPQYFATFWQLSLADIQVPTERYEQEMRVYQQLIKEADSGDGAKKPAAFHRHQEALEQLRAELKARALAHQGTRRRLAVEKDHWFPDNDGTTRRDLVQHLIQYCLLPRALLSPTDAMFAGKFIRLMHLNGARNFSSLTLYDRLFIEHIAPVIFTCTENEANSYARFIQVVLDDLMPWYKSQALFDKEVVGKNLPGFQMRWGNRRGGEVIPKEAMCSYEQFREVLRKWHDHMRAAFKLCLSSRDFMRIRNAIVVMNRIAHHFPLFETHGQNLIQVVEKLTQEETRGSLKVLGQGLLATLKKRQPEWIGKAPKKTAEKEAAPSGAAVQAPAVASKAESADIKTQPVVADTAGNRTPASKTPAPAKTNGEKVDTVTRPESLPQGPRNAPPSGPAADRERAASASAPARSRSPLPAAEPTARRNANAAAASEAQGQSQQNASAAYGSRASRVEALAQRPANGRAPASASSLPARPSGPGRDRERERESERDRERKKDSDRSNEERVGSGGDDQYRKTAGSHATHRSTPMADSPLPTGPRSSSSRADNRESVASSAEPISVSAARQAALDSMNPPASPASTSAAQGVRDRLAPAGSERGRHAPSTSKTSSRASSPSRLRDSEASARMSAASREPSPRTTRAEDDASARGRDARREREDRDRDYHKDRRDRDNRDARDARDIITEPRDAKDSREQGRDREERRRAGDARRSEGDRYGSSSDRDRVRDRTARDERRDGPEPRRPRDEPERSDSGAPRNDRAPPQGPRAATATSPSAVEDATAAAYKRRRVDRNDTAPPQTASAHDTQDNRYPRGGRYPDSRDPPSGPALRTESSSSAVTSSRPDLIDRPPTRSSSMNSTAPPSSRDDLSRSAVDPNRGRRSMGGSGAEATEAAHSPSGLKRSLADRLSGQERAGTPSSPLGSPVNDRATPDGPDQKRARVNRNRFSDVGTASAGRNDRMSAPVSPVGTDASRSQQQQQRRGPDIASGAAEGSATPPVRSVSISGSAARERERRETQRADIRDPPTGPSSTARGARGSGYADERDRDGGYGRRRGREEGRSFKDRSRRRAGEE
ncbi:hypothetical protein BCV69DRAFT_279956 [Microstroma glucosiphilum]|uniref:THO complex subunit 2 n=1 Tax=Pseudomicrostroma glucosiphilum TaxID=1684307 RepID=A0A316UFM3_9BASI|nr:hypothetical protein BCV69DRAFT_279956 [Pseudomicrostroma glucosiphilum]PWN24056.1 hypothetical protein BCV69DRAFT_279956 [Pseudomicrostroma glucosiphilum]